MEFIASPADVDAMFNMLESRFSPEEVYNYTFGKRIFTKMVNTINQRPEWVKYMKTFPTNKCFLWNNDIEFNEIFNAFYEDGEIDQLDSGNVFLFRIMETVAKGGLLAFQNNILANKGL